MQQEQLLTEGTVHYDVLKNSADGKKSNIKKIFRVKDDVNNVLQK